MNNAATVTRDHVTVTEYKEDKMLFHIRGNSKDEGVPLLLEKMAQLEERLINAGIPHETWKRRGPDFSRNVTDGIVIDAELLNNKQVNHLLGDFILKSD